MPELPEVETLHRQLRQVISREKILKIQILDEKLGNPGDIEGRDVASLYRQGKVLYIALDDGQTIALHLRMTGRLLWRDDSLPQFPHTRFTITFERGLLDLIDPRRFATFKASADHINFCTGTDPLEHFAAHSLWEIGRQKKLPIKSFLMDQRFVAGIGNIYACEILHGASIDPRRRTGSLSLEEWMLLADVTTAVLNKAIVCRGTTVSDWRDLFGQKGEYQNYLNVYAKKGERCPRCGGVIERLKLGGRGTYFCPACQK